ncbi:TetR/AcrR family transcriptional regulator [Sandaracinobacteroides saxicola]|uniref:TetR family transcriptional regulator C-terminal domain-containing protein n=1 Tax=Sandaracinobacteroides saxicola TaxID=2759707 RepID=A0A7G5ILR9_9SPHN|nr:TetR/AcrR family transcriptional regulator [Sandaracinobacteroides saxicola]QMW24311.1 TetR family transcriptional regulator C-terminal domain-containing protein [Sandaracinobacteroides saxicola]
MPKRVDPDERRARIADAAIESIAADGLDGTKLARISRRAGVTTGALTHYFEDKDAVLLAALEAVCERLMAKAAEVDARPAIEQLADALPVDEQSAKEWRVWIAFWGRAAFVPALARVHRDYYRRIEAALAAKIGGENAADIAAAIMAAVDGIGSRATLEPELWPPARQRALLTLMLKPLLEGKAIHDPTEFDTSIA